tara:strand:- start:95 stop:1552 length:1458 start_codon:yes stop_codon:yes gene_type:complete
VDVTTEAKDVYIDFRMRDNVAIDESRTRFYLNRSGHYQNTNLSDWEVKSQLENGDDDYPLENFVLEKISGDSKDATYRASFTINTDTLPSMTEDMDFLDTYFYKHWNIQMTAYDTSGHSQWYYLSSPNMVDSSGNQDDTDNEDFVVINTNIDGDLPELTYSIDKSQVNVTNESQEVVVTLDWNDPSGSNLNYFIEEMDPDLDGILNEDDETYDNYNFFTKYSEDDDTNEHQIFAQSYEIDETLTTEERAVIKLTYFVPQNKAPGSYYLTVPYILDDVDNGGWANKLDALEVVSDTETDPPQYELLSISPQIVDVTNENVEVTFRFRITDESGLENRDIKEDYGTFYGPNDGPFFADNLRSSARIRPCKDISYTGLTDHPRAFWLFNGNVADFYRSGRSYDPEDPEGWRVEGDNKDGIYETKVLIQQGSFPGLWNVELDDFAHDDIHGNYNLDGNSWLDDYVREDGSRIYPRELEIINTNIIPDED